MAAISGSVVPVAFPSFSNTTSRRPRTLSHSLPTSFSPTNRSLLRSPRTILRAIEEKGNQIQQEEESPPPPQEEQKSETSPPPPLPVVEKEGGGDLWSGVAEEIREIEWPAFGKVVGITGVVLGVIAGSSLVLLTVNALLAELSDRVFVGRGVQDFFG